MIFVIGSAVAGLAGSAGVLIAARVVQGVGVGGLTALTQVCLAVMIAPRERGRYSGYLGAVFAVGTVTGPLVGGVIVDTSWLGWRWCFYVGVPFAVAALVVLQRTLRLPTVRRDDVRIDWFGAFLIMAAVSVILIWVTLAGHSFDWLSWPSFVMVPGALLLGVAAVVVESRVREPVLPPWLFRVRTIVLAVAASLFIGIAMFGATVYLSQYFQLARGASPTESGVSTIPLVLGLFVSSLVSGRVITRTGRWKAWLVSGTVLVTAGFALMGTLRYDTPYWHVAVFMVLVGVGVGMTMQNLVLSVQNVVPMEQLGVASSGVAFFRSLGGAVGVSALGAVLASRVNTHIADGLAALGISASASTGTQIPDLSTLPPPVRAVIEESYGTGFGEIFLIAAPIAACAVAAVLFIREVPLRTSTLTASQTGPQDVEAMQAGSLAGGVSTEPVGADPEPVVADPADPDRATVTGGGGRAATAPADRASDGSRRPEGTVDGDADSRRQVAVPAEHVAATRPTGELVGTVTARSSGRPVPEAAVVVLDEGGTPLDSMVTGADGRYRFAALPSGRYTVVTSGYSPVATAVDVGDGTREQRDVRLSPAGAGGTRSTRRHARPEI